MDSYPSRPIRFRDYLPEIYRGDETEHATFQDRFLKAFEEVFEELQSLIEGVSPGDFRVIAESDPFGPSETPRPTATIEVEALQPSKEIFPEGSSIIRKGESSSGAKLAQDLPSNLSEPTAVEVDDAVFVRDLKPGERLEVTADEKNRATLESYPPCARSRRARRGIRRRAAECRPGAVPRVAGAI